MRSNRRVVALSDIGRIVTGTTPPSSEPDQFGSAFPFITPSDMSDDVRHVMTERGLSSVGAEKQKRRLLPSGAVCFVCIGATIGKVCMAHRPSFTNQQINSIVVDPGVADGSFVYYLLRVEGERIKTCASGAATPIINRTVFSAVEVVLPPLDMQRRIAAILSAYDDLIENNTRRIAILEAMARAIYRGWFVNFRFPGHEQVETVESELGPVPAGWAVRGLFEIADVTYGYPFKSKRFSEQQAGTPVIRIRDIPVGRSQTYTTETADERFVVRNGDLLIGMDGDFHRGKWAGGNAYLNQRVARVRSKGQLSAYHLFLALEAPIDYFGATITGTTVAHLGDKHLRQINVVLPPVEIGDHARTLLDPLFALELNLRIRNHTLRQIRDLLLPKLIAGEIDVAAAEEALAGAAA